MDAGTWVAGHTGGGLGVVGGRAASGAPFTASAPSWTAMCWVRFDTLTGAAPTPVMLEVSATAYALINLSAAANVSAFIRSGGASDVIQTASVGPASAGTWYHLAMTYDAGTRTLSCYANGTLVGTGVLPGSGTLDAGSVTVSAGGHPSVPSTCTVDDVRLYDSVLNTAAIAEAMDTPVPDPSSAPSGASVAVVTVTSSGTGRKVAAGSSITGASVSTTGAGSKTATGASTAAAGVTATGSGRRRASGAAVATITTTPAGAGSKATGGSSVATVGVTALGSGSPVHTRGGSSVATIGVAATGTGVARRSGASVASVRVTASGSGRNPAAVGGELALSSGPYGAPLRAGSPSGASLASGAPTGRPLITSTPRR
nr:LamG-like jellyroll fold domain-containing protein [Isoptericola halotolerans]